MWVPEGIVFLAKGTARARAFRWEGPAATEEGTRGPWMAWSQRRQVEWGSEGLQARLASLNDGGALGV